MAAIQDLVLTFCPKMYCTPQRKLKLLMPVWDLGHWDWDLGTWNMEKNVKI